MSHLQHHSDSPLRSGCTVVILLTLLLDIGIVFVTYLLVSHIFW